MRKSEGQKTPEKEIANFKFTKPFERGENPFIKSLCDTECYVKIASIASGQFQSELPIFKSMIKV